LAHIRHYILGDKKHGDNKQNQYFETHFGLENLLLHAWKLKFTHPTSGKIISIACGLPPHFQHIVEKLGWEVYQLH
jgi:tRNA pseudouridine65 synthase